MYIAFVSGGFPRPRGRGPIEARLAAACCPGTPRRFLDREVEAQLKRRKDAALTVEQTWFPRPRGRGPIEASSARRKSAASRLRFLDREVEAQLKHLVRRDAERLRPRGFLDREVEAQLKRPVQEGLRTP